MPQDLPPITAPAGFVPVGALVFGDRDTAGTAVSAANPLPIRSVTASAVSSALAGTTDVSTVIGPFAPDLGRAIWLTLSGTWTGTVTVQRSTDNGATKLPLTVAGAGWASFTASCNEPVGEETVAGATYYLAVTMASGTLAYRVQQ